MTGMCDNHGWIYDDECPGCIKTERDRLREALQAAQLAEDTLAEWRRQMNGYEPGQGWDRVYYDQIAPLERQAISLRHAALGMNQSWLADPAITLHNLAWAEDDLGCYWVADARRNGKPAGGTGSYYSIDDETGRRPSREEQEAELRGWPCGAAALDGTDAEPAP